MRPTQDKMHEPSSAHRCVRSIVAVALLATGVLVADGCGGLADVGDAGPAAPGDASVDLAVDGGGSGGQFELQGAPLPFAPTAHGFGLNAVLSSGDPAALRAEVRVQGTSGWGAPLVPAVRGPDVAEWTFAGLDPATRYDYQILAPGAGGDQALYWGSVVTQRRPGDTFTFALITDSHIGADLNYYNQGDPNVLASISAQVGAAMPDFMVNLGDMLDFHEYGFNAPPPDSAVSREAYLNYRTLLGDTLGNVAHFAVIGNWDGESGYYTPDVIQRSRQERMLYVPNPGPTTYPEGGSPDEDYYAFTWGDALFIVLNVMTYTPTPHLLSSDPGLPDDWTLGTDQFNWFANTLAHATSKWRFVLIHHPVGGAAGDSADAAYGRAGGQAAYVGEQAKVQQLMLQYGVQIFFYGHDHVFTDMQVDGIHYTLPGSAGAIWMFSKDQTGYAQSWQESGWGQVTVSPTSVDVRFLTMNGQVLYEYTLPQ